MQMKILWAAAAFFFGWFWAYLLLRQLLFNFVTAYPMIRRMNSLQEDLIAIGAKRYTAVSCIVCVILSAIVLFLLIRFFALYLQISFAVAAVIAFVMLLSRVSPKNRPMFDAFCNAYCRFVPDDELRTAMYNKKTGQINSRLKAMGITGTFIPEFKS